jgi:hypothetical protein
MDSGDILSGDYSMAVLPGTTNQVDASSAYPIAGDTGLAFGTGTGQQGITPHTGGSGIPGAVIGLWDWLNRPFTQPMSPVTLGLAVGVVLVAIIFWNFILYHIRIAAEAI